ncbi:MAG: NAD(P)-dependent oxidoreductase [Planctomycetota bacterium]|nr:NAD(P)-dependent oxidoreductase [Planctomycetota bacterium]
MEIAHPETTRVGWIGTGVMGRSMCSHLLKAGYKTSVFNRSAEKLNDLVRLGAVACSSPSEVASKSDVVFSMVGYPSDVEEVLLGEKGALAGLSPGGIIVDMTTSRPGLAVRIAAEALAKSVIALDAPVSGGDIGAREARLSIMVGGDQEAFDALIPLWKVMGATYVFQGPAGSGQHTKMVNQILIASGMVGLCEAILYAKQAGLDPELVLKSVSSGAAGSWSLSNLTPRILKRDFAPGFFVDHIVKDLSIAIEEAEKLGLQLPGLNNAKKVYEFLQTMDHGSSGTQALILAMAKLNGIDW